MAELPSGTVTFLFTDIEGSTPVWEREPERMHVALAHHDAILRTTIAKNGGQAFKKIGDAFQAAFAFPAQALAAALAAQRAFAQQSWETSKPLRVRMGLHVGPAVAEDNEYQTTHTLNRVARIMSCGHGGQILLSLEVAELVRRDLPVDVSLRDMGVHRLKGLTHLEHLFQVIVADLPGTFPPLKTLDAHPTNLPSQATALIGRAREIATVEALLRRDNVRLVTLTGPGGTGKTRLGLQIAAELLDAFGDGVWFVNLAPLSDSNLVASTIAQTFSVKESAGRSLLDSLKDYLREKHLLLLLDNFEQVADAAPLVGELLAAAPRLNVLATSRMPLHLLGEREFAVPPLGVPPHPPAPSPTPGRGGAGDVGELTQYEAVRLFIERALAVKADFTVTNANAPAIAEICYRLDGLPLAIELAAARIKLFPPQALLTRLGSRLKLLTGGARDLPERQQTIRNTIEWSYQLLDESEKTLFTRLGVFVDGWTLEAAEAMCNADGNLGMDVDGIGALLDQSLVRQEERPEGESRFVMLETIREYALEQLAARGEADVIRQQHAHYFLKLAEQAEPWIRVRRPERDPWLERLAVEHENLRAALEWFSQREEAELSLRLAGALCIFWGECFHWGEGRAWLETALGKSGITSAATRAQALVAAAHLAWGLGDSTTARVYIEEGLALFRGLGDKAAIAYALWRLGNILLSNGEYALARVYADECLMLFDEIGDLWSRPYALHLLGHIVGNQGDIAQAAVYDEEILTFYRQVGYQKGIGIGLIDLGCLAQLQGEWERAVALHAESLAIFREVGHKGFTALSLHNLGGAVLHQGDVQRAAACFAEGLALSREIGSKGNIAINLAGMAGVAAARRQPERSARLFGAAQALFDAMGQVLDPEDRAEYDSNAAIARAQLGDQAFAAAWEAGRTMTIAQAIAEALEPTPDIPAPAPAPPSAPQPAVATEYPAGLTVREIEVLRLVAQGLTDAQVAERLVLSVHTVHAHLRTIYGKLEVSSRAAATRFAVDHGLV